MSRFSSAIGVVFIASLFSYIAMRRFEVHATYHSTTNPERKYVVKTIGTYERGADIAEAYTASIVVVTADTRHRLMFRAERFTPRLTQIDPSLDLAAKIEEPVDADTLAKIIETLDPTASRGRVKEEARDLFEVLKSAGLGPKIGLPQTQALVLVSSSYKYQ